MPNNDPELEILIEKLESNMTRFSAHYPTTAINVI